ncbi:MAG: hypothetical protein QGG17_02120 [Rhodospirillales bacterium]|jgi:hypothetical protein|nr:hypothetical protein [Rhodospirillales bacterium]MDP6803909.1 hypothetical protein [Rhodospirillales bacterium]
MKHLRALTAGALGAFVLVLAGAGAEAQGPRAGDRKNGHVEGFIKIFDTDGDGLIAGAEITAEQQRLFTASDVDGDGLLSVNEFRRRGRLLQSLNTTTLFDLMDVDGSQTLAGPEVFDPSSRWFARYDTDGDGKLNANEIANWRQR